MKDESYLLRWIRARDGDLERAEEFFRTSLQWRKDNDIDAIIGKEIPQIFSDKFPRQTECHDKAGRPVITVPFGTWDVPFSVATYENIDQFKLYTLQGCELLMDEIHKADKARKEGAPRITQCVLLIDMAGFSFMNLLNVYAVQNGLALLQSYEANYPETLYACYLINSSSMINMLLNLVKPVLAVNTYEKIRVFNTNVEEWKTAILEQVDEELLPIQFGGTKEPSLLDEVDDGVEEAVEVVEEDDEFHEAKEDHDLALD